MMEFVGGSGEANVGYACRSMSFFKGRETFSVDDKGRVNVPAKMRKNLAPEANDTFYWRERIRLPATRGSEGYGKTFARRSASAPAAVAAPPIPCSDWTRKSASSVTLREGRRLRGYMA